MNSVKTNKGTILPLMNLKGKPYMMVAHRIVWFNEEVSNYTIETEFLQLTDEKALVKATVSIYDKEGKLLKRGVGTKSESKKDFPDFVEKSETGACGRAITMLGFGTAYAIADLDEGDRIIDSPVTDTRNNIHTTNNISTPVAKLVEDTKPAVGAVPSAPKKTTFRKPAKPATAEAASEDWSN